MLPHCCILILNWNGWEDTAECLRSVHALDYPNHGILVVDNGSTDESETNLRRQFPGLEILQTGENLGFAGGNNVGIRHALSRGAQAVWLLNNDTVVEPKALSALVHVLESDRRIGIVGSKICYFAEPKKIWFAGGFWRKGSGLPTHRGVNEIDHGQYDQVCEVDYATGCSLLIRSEVILQIGPLCEDYFLYWEELDWNIRAARRGWKIVYTPSSLLWHRCSASFKGDSYLTHYYLIRNCLLFYRRHAPLYLPRILYRTVRQQAEYRKAGRPDAARGFRDGFLDFFLFRFGKNRRGIPVAR